MHEKAGCDTDCGSEHCREVAVALSAQFDLGTVQILS